MVSVFVYGLPPSGISQKALVRLCTSVRKAVSSEFSSKDAHIRVEDVVVFFPSDLIRQDLGTELICVINGIKSENWGGCEGRVSDALCSFAEKHLKECRVVDVSVTVGFLGETNTCVPRIR